MIKVGILGASGRMGQKVKDILKDDFDDEAVVSVEKTSKGESFDELLGTDVIIDFSLPVALNAYLKAALGKGDERLPILCSGTTGLGDRELDLLGKLANITPVLWTSNFSAGANALLRILRDSAPLLEGLGYDPSVLERHHVHKKDKPSGTAISIQRTISPAGPGNIPVESIREGEIIGDHEVTFKGRADRLVISHFANDRSIFARGAVVVALWMVKNRKSLEKKGKVYNMDVYMDSLLKD